MLYKGLFSCEIKAALSMLNAFAVINVLAIDM